MLHKHPLLVQRLPYLSKRFRINWEVDFIESWCKCVILCTRCCWFRALFLYTRCLQLPLAVRDEMLIADSVLKATLFSATPLQE